MGVSMADSWALIGGPEWSTYMARCTRIHVLLDSSSQSLSWGTGSAAVSDVTSRREGAVAASLTTSE